jgi:hypothetical protein
MHVSREQEMDMTRLLWVLEECTPYLFLTLNQLCLAVFMILVESVISTGRISALVIVVYEHLIATILLSLLAFFLEK